MSNKDVEDQLTELTRRVEALETRLSESGEARVLREAEPVYYVGANRQVQGGVVIPANVFEDAGLTPQEMLVELALYLFDKEVMTLGQAKTLAGMSVGDFMTLLGQRGIEMHYGVEEFMEDIETLKETGLWK
jgi:predicted HTH domain antitoxin